MNHIGEVITANNGQRMTLIAYRGYEDIDVQFDDGTIITNRSYQWFKKGGIRNPNYIRSKGYTISELMYDNKGKKVSDLYRYEYNGLYYKDLPSLLRDLNRIDELEKLRGILRRYPHLSIHEALERSKNTHKGKKVIYNGVEYDSIISFCRNFNIKLTSLKAYIRKYGSFEDGVRYYLAYKNTKSIKDLCIENSINVKRFVQFRIRNSKKIGELSILEQIDMYKAKINKTSITKKCSEYGLNAGTVSDFYYKHKDLVSRDACINLYRMKEKFEFGNVTDSGNFIYANDFYFTCKCRTCGKKDILSTAQMLEHKCDIN